MRLDPTRVRTLGAKVGETPWSAAPSIRHHTSIVARQYQRAMESRHKGSDRALVMIRTHDADTLAEPPALEGCTLECLQCISVCAATIGVLLDSADREDLESLAGLLLDCMTAGHAHTAFVARRSARWLQTAALWREVCARCAEGCEGATRRLADEAALRSSVPLDTSLAQQLRACAAVCRHCVSLCPCGVRLFSMAEASA